MSPKCGDDGFCVGYEADNEVYCYGRSDGCLWDSNDCEADHDCRKYSSHSAKFTDGDQPTCGSGSRPSGWRAAACSCHQADTDPEIVLCTQIIDEFNFGMTELEDFDENTGESLGKVLTKVEPEGDPTVHIKWETYQKCVRYLTQDPWTRTEYLKYATAPQCAHPDQAKFKHLLLGEHHPVILTPSKPEVSRFFLIPAYDHVVGSFIKHTGTFNPEEEAILRNLVFEGDCVVEIGSNIGAYTVTLADQVGKTGLVYAFEPFRKIFQIMNANVALHGYGNVITKQIGVSNKKQFITVQAPGLNDFTNLGAARVFYQQKEEFSHVPFEGHEEIEVETLDTLHFNCGQTSATDGKKVDFLKIDTEGTELHIIEGGLGLIGRDLPLIYVESQPFFQAGDDTFLRKMREYGYSCSPIKNLESQEILLCIPMARYEELMQKLPLLRR